MTRWTATDAARELGQSGRTARDRAKRAHEAGDRRVEHVGGHWIAAEAWWRACFADEPKTRGKPRLKAGRN